VGDATHPALGERHPARGGTFARGVRAELAFTGGSVVLEREDVGSRRVRARLDGASGTLRRTGAPPWRTLHARGVGSATEGARAVARFARRV